MHEKCSLAFCTHDAKWLCLEMGSGHKLFCEDHFPQETGAYQYNAEGFTYEDNSKDPDLFLQMM